MGSSGGIGTLPTVQCVLADQAGASLDRFSAFVGAVPRVGDYVAVTNAPTAAQAGKHEPLHRIAEVRWMVEAQGSSPVHNVVLIVA
jgi:hypothetical protein